MSRTDRDHRDFRMPDTADTRSQGIPDDRLRDTPETTAGETASDREADDFWDMTRLLPRSATRSRPFRPRHNPTTVEMELPPITSSTLTGQTSSPSREPSLHAVPFDRYAPSPDAPERPPERNSPLSRSAPENPEAGKSQNRPSAPVFRSDSRPLPRPDRRDDTGKAGSASSVCPGVTHYVPPHSPEESLTSPADGSPSDVYENPDTLLHRVSIEAWPNEYHYFDRFAQDAARFQTRKPDGDRMEAFRRSGGTSVPCPPFASFFPQYVQLKRNQTDWYLLWRECVLSGAYPPAPASYILLFIFELINLPADGETAKRNRDLMAHIWEAYRKPDQNAVQTSSLTAWAMIRYIPNWLCDYCLIHHLTAPVALLSPMPDELVDQVRFREFYFSSFMFDPSSQANGETARILLQYGCQYDYRRSKFAQGEHRALFDRIIPSAITAVIPLLFGKDGLLSSPEQDSTLSWDAYAGALCSFRFKRKISVSYMSFSRSNELRFTVGDAVRHVENRLRAYVGIRSRLSVMSLPVPIREELDRYLSEVLPAQKRVATPRKPAKRPAYEALYDLPVTSMSLKNADEIENASWETTRVLTESFPSAAGEDLPPVPSSPVDSPTTDSPTTGIPAQTVAPEAGESDRTTGENGQSPSEPGEKPPTEPADRIWPERESPSGDGAEATGIPFGELALFIRCALKGDLPGERAFASARHCLMDAVADEINGMTLDSDIGDIVLEDAGDGGFRVIDEYRDRIEHMLS